MRFRAKLWSIVIIMMSILPIFATFFTSHYAEEEMSLFVEIQYLSEELLESGYVPMAITNLFIGLQQNGIFVPPYIIVIFGLTIIVEVMELMLEAVLFLPRLCKKLMRKFEEK